MAVTALCAAAICGVMKFDLFGIETRVPAVSQIESLTFRAADNSYTLDPEEDAALVEEIRAVHLTIARDADYIIGMNENWAFGDEEDFERISMYNSVHLTYHLKNGTRVIRRYSVPISMDRLNQEGTYDFALDRLVNSDAMKAERFHQNDGYQPDSGYLYVDTWKDGSISFGTKEARAIHEAVKKDIASGACGNYDWFDQGRAGQYAMDLNLDFQTSETVHSGDTHTRYDSINIRVYPAMTHTVDALEELGLVAEQELKTYGELYPEEYEEKYSLDAPTASDAMRYGDFGQAASVGIIGGTDGPTEIMVAGAL